MNTLKDQLSQELRRRQQYISKSTRAGEEIRDIRSKLDSSLSTVGRDINLDPLLLEHETRKLDESLSRSSYSPSRLGGRRRSPVRGSSPPRMACVTSTPSFRSSRSPILRRKLKQWNKRDLRYQTKGFPVLETGDLTIITVFVKDIFRKFLC